MDIKEDLRQLMHEYGGHSPVKVRAVTERALAEIERLEKLAASTVDLTNELVTCRRKLDAYTDRMITAGLMS